MAIDRWDPFRDLQDMRQAMDRLWQSSFPTLGSGTGSWAPRMDVMEEQNQYLVRLAMPGVKPEDVQIQVEQNMLTVSGELRREEAPSGGRYLHQEHYSGRFSRSVSLPAGIDADKANAKFEHGVLTITLPKSEAARPRRIQIQSGGQTSSQPQMMQGEAGGEKGEAQNVPISSGGQSSR